MPRALPVLLVALALGAAAAGREAAVGPGPTRQPDVDYEPTPHAIVTQMLKFARVGAHDVVFDLGCGDGRIVIAAARHFGARGVCVDIDPRRIRESFANAQRSGVAGRIVFLNRDLFEIAIGEATVVTLFLWPSVNLELRPKLWRELKPGARVVSYLHDMGDWAPQETRNVPGPGKQDRIFLWVIPMRGRER